MDELVPQSLIAGRVEIQATGMVAHADLSDDEVVQLALYFSKTNNASMWCLASLLAIAREQIYTEISEQVGMAVQTLRNMAYIASRIPPEYREVGLPFWHYNEIALTPPDMHQSLFDAVRLTQAKGTNVTQAWLRDTIREFRNARPAPANARVASPAPESGPSGPPQGNIPLLASETAQDATRTAIEAVLSAPTVPRKIEEQAPDIRSINMIEWQTVVLLEATFEGIRYRIATPNRAASTLYIQRDGDDQPRSIATSSSVEELIDKANSYAESHSTTGANRLAAWRVSKGLTP